MDKIEGEDSHPVVTRPKEWERPIVIGFFVGLGWQMSTTSPEPGAQVRILPGAPLSLPADFARGPPSAIDMERPRVHTASGEQTPVSRSYRRATMLNRHPPPTTN